jgi:hypothetical protein
MVYISLYDIEGFDELNMKLLYLDCVKSLIDMFLYHTDNFKLIKKNMVILNDMFNKNNNICLSDYIESIPNFSKRFNMSKSIISLKDIIFF